MEVFDHLWKFKVAIAESAKWLLKRLLRDWRLNQMVGYLYPEVKSCCYEMSVAGMMLWELHKC